MGKYSTCDLYHVVLSNVFQWNLSQKTELCGFSLSGSTFKLVTN